MPDNILNHDDGIIDQDADGKNQREQRYAIQRVAVEIENGQRQRKRDRNRQQDDSGFAPAQCNGNEQGYRECGDEKMLEEFVRFVLGRFTVIARDRDVQIAGKQYRREEKRFCAEPLRKSAWRSRPYAWRA